MSCNVTNCWCICRRVVRRPQWIRVYSDCPPGIRCLLAGIVLTIDWLVYLLFFFFFFQAEDGIRSWSVTGVQTCALPICKSLLPAGVIRVDGGFARGDAVVIRGPDGIEVGRGLVAYDAEDADKIKGRSSADIMMILGFGEIGRASCRERGYRVGYGVSGV